MGNFSRVQDIQTELKQAITIQRCTCTQYLFDDYIDSLDFNILYNDNNYTLDKGDTDTFTDILTDIVDTYYKWWNNEENADLEDLEQALQELDKFTLNNYVVQVNYFDDYDNIKYCDVNLNISIDKDNYQLIINNESLVYGDTFEWLENLKNGFAFSSKEHKEDLNLLIYNYNKYMWDIRVNTYDIFITEHEVNTLIYEGQKYINTNIITDEAITSMGNIEQIIDEVKKEYNLLDTCNIEDLTETL